MSSTLPTKGELRTRFRSAVDATGIPDPLEAVRVSNTSLTFTYGTTEITLDDLDLRAIRDGYTGAEHTAGRGDFWRLGRAFGGLDRG
jgi:hypothetical protein